MDISSRQDVDQGQLVYRYVDCGTAAPPNNLFSVISIATEIGKKSFYIQFLLKSLCDCFDEPIKRIGFVIPKKQFLYHVLNTAILPT